MRAGINSFILTAVVAAENFQLGAGVSPQTPDLPTSPTTGVLDYRASVLGYQMAQAQVDQVIQDLYNDGHCTDCIIYLIGHAAPSAASATELAELRIAQGNTVHVT